MKRILVVGLFALVSFGFVQVKPQPYRVAFTPYSLAMTGLITIDRLQRITA